MSDSEDDSVDDLAGDLLALHLDPQRHRPSAGYRCGACKEIGQHFINFCPTALETGKRTPYQGSRRGFGQYQCYQCGRLWVSSRSWANTTQDCETCKIAIYAHRQRPLHKPKGMDNVCDQNKEHPQQLCGKCRQLGYPCIRKGDERRAVNYGY